MLKRHLIIPSFVAVTIAMTACTEKPAEPEVVQPEASAGTVVPTGDTTSTTTVDGMSANVDAPTDTNIVLNDNLAAYEGLEEDQKY